MPMTVASVMIPLGKLLALGYLSPGQPAALAPTDLGAQPKAKPALDGYRLPHLWALFVLGAIAFLACWVPARRASAVNPLIALREG